MPSTASYLNTLTHERILLLDPNLNALRHQWLEEIRSSGALSSSSRRTALALLNEAQVETLSTEEIDAVDSNSIASRIDHTLLKPAFASREISTLCSEAHTHQMGAVCVPPVAVPLAVELRENLGASFEVVTVAGFPLGYSTSSTKAFEIRDAFQNHADEVDVVGLTSALKSGEEERYYQDLCACVAGAEGQPIKVILETALLTIEETLFACLLAEAAGVSSVKTSTGFSTGGATLASVSLMRAVVSPHIKVKASGGIRTREDALKMVAVGADRLGTSSGIAILTKGEHTP